MKRRTLEGTLVYLEPISKAYVSEEYAGWFNDPEVTRFNSHGEKVMTVADIEAYVEQVAQSETDAVFAIVARDTGAHIGNITLQKIDSKNNSAEYAIIVGNKNYWGKGVALEASKLLLEFGFKDLGLHRVWLGTSIDNEPMQRLAERLGCKKEGQRREAMRKQGAYIDVVEYGILASEYTQ